jgi:hypothetical protein
LQFCTDLHLDVPIGGAMDDVHRSVAVRGMGAAIINAPALTFLWDIDKAILKECENLILVLESRHDESAPYYILHLG